MSATHRTSERGATAVVVALLLTGLLGMLGLALNLGHLIAVRGEMQNAVDSAAIAGASELNGTVDGLTLARTAATNFAERHVTDGNPGKVVEASQIQFGHWTRGISAATGTFEVITGVDALSAWRINAVRVGSAQGNPVWMGALLGKAGGTTQVGAAAIAVSGGLSEIECADMPFVLREGCVKDRCPAPKSDPEYSGGYFVVELSSDKVDTAGTTNLLPQANVSSTLICEILQNPNYCEDHGHTALTEGDLIGTANGAQWGANCGNDGDTNPADDGKICEILSKRVGQRATIPVVRYLDETETQCDGKYVADDATIRGFSTIRIVFVQCAKKGTPVYDPSVADKVGQFTETCFPATKGPSTGTTCVILEYLCNAQETKNVTPGGEWYGTSTLLPWLAR